MVELHAKIYIHCIIYKSIWKNTINILLDENIVGGKFGINTFDLSKVS